MNVLEVVSPDQVAERLEPLLVAVSRTAAYGVVDTSASSEKRQLAIALDHADVAAWQHANTRSACLLISEHVGREPSDGAWWQQFVRQLNIEFTRGLTTRPGAYREHSTPPRFGQLAPAAIPRYFQTSCAIIARQDGAITRGQAPGGLGLNLAAYALWVVDLYGHVFADGCARTGLALSTMIMLRYGLPQPAIGSRDEFYRAGHDGQGGLRWSRWCTYFTAAVRDGE